MNTPVSFEIAKLLKEKGFDIASVKCYAEERFIDKNTGGDLFTGVFRLCTKSRFHKRYYSAPTIAEVVMRLYEKHGIWISVYTMETWPNGNERKQLFDYSLKQMRFGLIDIPKKPEEFNSPTEAYSQAIEYTLKNLI